MSRDLNDSEAQPLAHKQRSASTRARVASRVLIGMCFLLLWGCGSDGSGDAAPAATDAPAATEVPVEAPTETAAETPTDTPVRVPKEEFAELTMPRASQPNPTVNQPTVSLLAAGADIRPSNGIFFDAEDRLWVASVFSGIHVVDPETGETLRHYTPEDGVVADDLTIAPDGTVYFTDIINGQVGIIDPDGTWNGQFLPVGPGANSITLSDDGRLFVGADFLGDGLFEMDVTGATEPRVVIAEPGWINGMDFGPDGFLYGPRWTEGTIVRIDADTGDMMTIIDQSESVYSAAKFSADGVLHSVEALPGKVVQINIETGEQTLLATVGGTADNLAFDSTGRLYVSNAQDGSIYEVQDNGDLRTVKEPGLSGSSGIYVEERDGVERVTVLVGQALVTFDGATGEELERLATAPDTGSLFDPPAVGGAIRLDDGNVLVVDWGPGGGVETWNVQAGVRGPDYAASFVFDIIRFQGDLYVSQGLPNSVAVLDSGGATPAFSVAGAAGLAATDDALYAASFTDGTVLQLFADGQALDEPEVIANGLDDPEGLAILPDGNLVVIESGSGDVTHIDVEAGTTTVLAEDISTNVSVVDLVPAWSPNGIATSSSGTIYVTAPVTGNVYRIER